MRTQTLQFPNNQSLCVFPDDIKDLQQVITELNLPDGQPVIVLIGGSIRDEHEQNSQIAIRSIAKFAEARHATVICGGTDLGIMALIGQYKADMHYSFNLIGVTVRDIVTWRKGPKSKKFLWWGRERWPLAQGYTHFILVPGKNFGDESPWIVELATLLSRGNQSITILANGGAISRKDIELSLEHGRSVIALAGTGRLADELATQAEKPDNVIIAPSENEEGLITILQQHI